MRVKLFGIVALVVVLAALVFIGDPFNHRWLSRQPPTAPVATADVPKPEDQAAPGAATARGEVVIDARRQQLIGVRTTPVVRATLSQRIRTSGTVRDDETRLADVNVKVEGWIRDLFVNYTGQPVTRGQALFTLYSPELLATEQEFLLALRTRDQLQSSQIADARRSADELVASARQRLALWDLPPDEIRALEERRVPHEALTFRSPAGGVVVEKQAVKGMHVTAGQTLYKIADLSVVWVEADVYESELSLVGLGQRATVMLEAYPDQRFAGRVLYIYPTVDAQTRTAKVRYEFANRAGRLKPGMFATVEMETGRGTGLVVPTDAVLDSGSEQIVFVAQGDGRFEPRTVKAGRRLGETIQIVQGLKEGESVATGATFFLDSESQLRASLQGYQPLPATAAAAPAARLDITFRTIPDPPKSGENQFEVDVKGADGKPVDEADVAVQLFMAAMPTMNMPAMRNEVKLSGVGGGVYRGTGQVTMSGRWDATITVSKSGQRLGSKQQPLVAR